jgi:hypothetical protein
MTLPLRCSGFTILPNLPWKAFRKAYDLRPFGIKVNRKNTLHYLAGKDAKQFWFARRRFGYQFQILQVLKYFGL